MNTTDETMDETRRGRPAKLTPDQIVHTALLIADAEGLDAVSMRRLARELEVSPMALYGYFEAKRDLVRGMLDEVSRGLGPQDTSTGGWPDQLAEMGRRVRATITAHPGLAQLFVTAPALGGRAMHVVDDMVALLRREGVSGEVAVRAVYAVMAYAIGFSAQEVPRRQRQGDPGERRRALESLPTERFPNMVELAEYAAGFASDEQFESGLQALIAGYGISSSA